ncbi:MAG: D-alanine--D-alanine ligase [Eubacterium sp.]|nr:D-alanine--D-alanine ligase [Eubacterium sp.]
MDKKNVVVIFGGRSSEHEVSCISAATVIAAIDKEKYNPILVGITKDGKWLLVDKVENIRDGSWRKSKVSAVISPDKARELIIREKDEMTVSPEGRKYYQNVYSIKIDVAFPVLHGLFGEDGTIQGLLEMALIPFVGCGHLSSAITMDKFFTKVIADSVNIDQAAYVPVRSYELADMDKVVRKIEAAREYPVFIKPSNAGSSVGISKAHNREELIEGLKLAAKHDTKILVEEAINGREIECAVYGFGDDAFASGVGEIVAAAEFYDYDAKYNNAASKTIIDPDIPEEKVEEIRKAALKIYRACDGFGMSRVDFFLENETNRVVFNEINTIPGHTSISMYPMLMEKAGHPMSVYINDMIEMAYKRHNYKNA